MTIREMMAMYHSLQFVEELLDYIGQYPDDDYMTMECLCRKLVKYKLMRKVDGYYIADRKTDNSSEKLNNCEHITEDGVTCAKYPACDDCLNNPLNKVKGSERLVKGSEKPNNCEWSVEYAKEMLDTMPCEECGHWEHGAGDHYYCALLEMRQECFFESKGESTLMFANKPKDEPTISKMEQVAKDINVRSKIEPQTDGYISGEDFMKIFDEPQTDCQWK